MRCNGAIFDTLTSTYSEFLALRMAQKTSLLTRLSNQPAAERAYRTFLQREKQIASEVLDSETSEVELANWKLVKNIFSCLETFSITYEDGMGEMNIGLSWFARELLDLVHLMERGRVIPSMAIMENYTKEITRSLGCKPKLLGGTWVTDPWVVYCWDTGVSDRMS